jgi:hypothetical protein
MNANTITIDLSTEDYPSVWAVIDDVCTTAGLSPNAITNVAANLPWGEVNFEVTLTFKSRSDALAFYAVTVGDDAVTPTADTCSDFAELLGQGI